MSNSVVPNIVRCATVVATAVWLSGAGGAIAQTYPSKPIRVIVGAAPGGGTDFVARLMANKLTEALGQRVIVENRAGAGSSLGYEAGVRAPPDGYTLIMISPSYVINPSLYPLKFDALLRPKRKADGSYAFTWFQGGAVLEAERLDPPMAVASKWTPTEAQLADYVGDYPLMPNFALRVSATGAKLFVQGTNQRSLEFVSVEKDVFVADSVSAEIDFERDAGDKVVSLTLKQRGQILRGERH